MTGYSRGQIVRPNVMGLVLVCHFLFYFVEYIIVCLVVTFYFRLFPALISVCFICSLALVYSSFLLALCHFVYFHHAFLCSACS